MATKESRNASDQLKSEKSEAELKYDIPPPTPENIVRVLLVAWRKPGKSVQLVSRRGDVRFLLSDLAHWRSPSRRQARGSLRGEAAEWGSPSPSA